LRRLWIAPAIVAAALAVAALDADRGIPAWLRLRADLDSARERMGALREEIEASERDAAALRDDGFAVEAAIRRDLGFAKPGETVVRTLRHSDSSLRIP